MFQLALLSLNQSNIAIAIPLFPTSKKFNMGAAKTRGNSIETNLPNLHVGFQLLIFELTSELSLPMLGATHGPPLKKWMAMDTNHEKVG